MLPNIRHGATKRKPSDHVFFISGGGLASAALLVAHFNLIVARKVPKSLDGKPLGRATMERYY
jgi:hypothetical protein